MTRLRCAGVRLAVVTIDVPIIASGMIRAMGM